MTRYNSYSDTGRFEPLRALFAEDAVMEMLDSYGEVTVFTGRVDIEQIFTGAQRRVQAQIETTGPTYVRHFTATHQIDLVDADHATGRCYFAVIVDRGLDHWGRYIDRYVRVEGEWKFERRRVALDGRDATSWFAS